MLIQSPFDNVFTQLDTTSHDVQYVQQNKWQAGRVSSLSNSHKSRLLPFTTPEQTEHMNKIDSRAEETQWRKAQQTSSHMS